MDLRVDFLAEWLVRTLSAEAVLLSLGSVAMVICRQPARRVVIARSVLLGSLALVPLRVLDLGPLWSWDRLTSAWPGESALVASFIPRAVQPWMSGLKAVSGTFLFLYAALCGLMLGWTLLGLWASRRLRKRSAAPPAGIQEAYRALASPYGRAPELLVSPHARGPMLLGTLRPSVVIPSSLADPRRFQDARLSLLHELEHHQRGDSRSVLLASLVQCCWPVLPMVWWIRAQLGLDLEFLADRGASARFGTQTRYASSLVSIASDPQRQGSAPASDGGQAPLMLRILMLVKSPFPVEARVPPWWRIAVAGMVGLVVWASAGVARLDQTVPARAPSSGGGVFRLSKLVVQPSPAGPDGRVQPYRVMCPLPPEFGLSVKVWAAPRELARMEVAGVPLDSGTGQAQRAFHRVRIRRRDGQLSAWVDGKAISTPENWASPRWVEFRPAPDRSGRFRNLVVHW